MNNSKIALIYICTGKYHIFWEKYYTSCTNYFFPDFRKDFFVFTDNEKVIRQAETKKNVFTYYLKKSGWPYDTLLRFNAITMIQDKLRQYDFCFFCNANTVFLKKVDQEIIPLPDENYSVLLWRHTNTYEDDKGITFQPERNPESTAYVSFNSLCREYGGGFFGGTAEGFITMSITLRDRIAQDLRHGIIAIWHDQSHIIKYATEIKFVEVPRNVIVSEEYMEGKNPYIIFLNKENYGGNENLRELPLLQKFEKRVYKTVYKIAKRIHLIPIVKRFLPKK